MAKSKKNKKARAKNKATAQSAGTTNEAPSRASVDRNAIDEILNLAEQLDLGGAERQIVATIAPLADKIDLSDERTYLRYLRLLALGHAHQGNFPEAEQVASEGINACATGVDFYHVLSFSQYSLGEYAKAVVSANKLLSLLDDPNRRRDLVT